MDPASSDSDHNVAGENSGHKFLVRGSDGRFASLNLDNGINAEEMDKLQEKSMRRSQLRMEIFEKFLRVFFLEGTVQDWIPNSSRSGPLVKLFDGIIKKRHRLGRILRAKKMKRFHLETSIGERRTHMARIWTRDASHSDGPNSRIRVFKYRRMPSLSRQISEMDPVKAWIKFAAQRKALHCSEEDSYATCLVIIGTYRNVGGACSYVGYPQLPARPSYLSERAPVGAGSSDDENSGDGNNSVDAVGAEQPVETERLSGSNTQDCEQDSLRLPSPGTFEAAESRDSPTDQRRGSGTSGNILAATDEDVASPKEVDAPREALRDPFSQSTATMMETAYDDRTFLMLCLLFDDKLDIKFDFFAGIFLEKYRGGRPLVSPLVMDVLVYCHWKYCGVIDQREHEDREWRLRMAKDILTSARMSFANSQNPLKTYDEMRWSFL